MYTAFFGLKEAPFTIAPNPAFLFMSDRHREALAHLSFGLGGSDSVSTGGFVLLTGEVGTGKTTICRSVMEQLPENTQASFILNPTLSCEELLATICDNLKIRYKKTGATLKYLTDKIHDKLLKNHQANINTLLIIDEAQHLQPEVLEQLRLLTNLETNTQKLLQVILIGQPELQQLLKRRDLRQLAQRITARYNLQPLTKEEVKQYIQHRLSVAQCTRPLFNNAAMAAIHRISKGIPRIINLLCDRCLINAYGNNDALVNKKIVLKSAVDALGDEGENSATWSVKSMKIALVASFLVISVVGAFWLGQSNWQGKITTSELVKQAEPQPEVELADSNNEQATKQEPDKQAEMLALIAAQTATMEKMMAEFSVKQEQQEAKQEQQQAKVVGYQPERVKENHVSAEKAQPEFKVTATEGVSNELLARFQSAIDETSEPTDVTAENSSPTTDDFDEDKLGEDSVKSLLDMPQSIQDAVPPLQFEQHIFASDGQGWVRVNGEDKYQGEEISSGLALIDILPQKVILSFQGEQFSLPALSSW